MIADAKINCKIILVLTVLLISYSARTQDKVDVDFSILRESLNESFAADFDFSVLIEIEKQQVFSEYFGGSKKKESGIPDEKILFNIASISKSITSVGIMKLVDQKRVNLDDTLNKFFNSVPSDKASISIRYLLSHQSGLGQNYPLVGVQKSEEALKTILNQKLEFSPGEGFRYSNQNFQLLALIIEKVSSTSYESFIRNEVLIPLAMHDTYFWDEVDREDNIARMPKRISRMIGKRNWGWVGSTGIFTTTADLSKFWNGFFNNGFLEEEAINEIFESHYTTSSGTQVGLGFFKYPNTKWDMTELWTRGTESWGHNSSISYFPDKKVTIIVSTNSGEIGKKSLTGNKLVSEKIADFLFK